MQAFNLNNRTTKVIKLKGELDLDNTGDFKKELTVNNGYKEVLVDLAEVTFLTRHFIDVLIEAKRQWPGQYHKIKLLNPNEIVRNLLALNNLDTIYEIQNIYPTAW